MKTPKPKLNADQIRGQLATMESEKSKLDREHQQEQEAFNKKAADRAKRYNELTGGIAALQALLA